MGGAKTGQEIALALGASWAMEPAQKQPASWGVCWSGAGEEGGDQPEASQGRVAWPWWGDEARVPSTVEHGWAGVLERPSSCCVESVLEMGSHMEGNQLGDLKLPR